MASTFDSRSIGVRAARPLGACSFPIRLGTWELVRRIGGGELTDVYLARAADSPRERPPCYALKVLRDEWQDDPRGQATLAREVLVARQVVDAHLVPILAASLDEPPYYLAMPYLEGQSLAAQLGCETLLELPVIFWIARQTAEGTLALARAGWMHGDVKPANIVVSSWGHATLVDLGFAARGELRASLADRPLLGTLNYIAPELLSSSTGGDSQSDVYSLGVVLFEMLTGRLPFDADDVAELASLHRQALPSDVRRLVPHIPIRAARLVQQMLSKQPLRRPSPAELVERLVTLEIETFAERLTQAEAP
jgi:serine/threonine-protein kinase